MYRMSVTGTTMLELKRNLEEAAKAIFWNPKSSVAPKQNAIIDKGTDSPFSNTLLIDEEVPEEKSTISIARIREEADAERQAPIPFAGDESYDARGIPWDARVHSASKEKVTDGSWRKRRGVDDATKHQVEASLPRRTQTVNVGAGLPVQPTFPPTNTLATPEISPTTEGVGTAPIPTPVQPVAVVPFGATPMTGTQAVQQYTNIPMPPPDETKPAHTLQTFKANFGPTISELISKGKITPEYMQRVVSFLGIKHIWEAMSNDVQLGQIFDNFVEMGFITKVG